MTYTAANETYVVTGAPVNDRRRVRPRDDRQDVDLLKAADTIVVDGNQQIRTQTKGGSGKCP